MFAFCIICCQGEVLIGFKSCQRTGAQPDRVFDKTAFNLRMQSGHALVVEWHLSAHQHVQNDAKTPHINFGTGVDSCIEELRGCEV